MYILSYFLFSLYLEFKEEMRYHSKHMTAYTVPRTQTISPDVAARKAARKKVIERARQLERESYKALMRRKRMLQASSDVDTIAEVC